MGGECLRRANAMSRGGRKLFFQRQQSIEESPDRPQTDLEDPTRA